MDVDVVGGLTYAFNQNDATNDNHPLIFSTTTSTGQAITSGVTFKLDGSTVSYAQYTDTTTFNAATTRSVEITVSQSADFYFICYVHGSGMGGVMDLQVDSWGAGAWSVGNWNDNENSTFSVTGNGATIATDGATAFLREGWGTTAWNNGEWGDVTDSGSGILSAIGWGREDWAIKFGAKQMKLQRQQESQCLLILAA